MIKVYHFPWHLHRNMPTGFDENNLVRYVKAHIRSYVHVADVDSSELDTAWYLTNSVHYNWTENREVTIRVNTTEIRSSSVGDILEKDNGCQYVVCSVGFQLLY